MGLFSKLFSREDEDPESQNQAAQGGSPNGEESTAKSDESAVKNDARANTATADKPAASSDSQAKAAIPPLPAAGSEASADPKLGVRKPSDPKREAVSPGRAPTPAGAMRAPAVPPPAAADAKAEQAQEPGKRTPSRPPRAQGTAPARKVTAPMRAATEVVGKPKKATPAALEQPAPLPAPAPAPSPRIPSVLPLEAALDAAMAALTDTNAAPHAANDALNDNAGDQRALAETFTDMARVHAEPLRDLMFQLSVGRTPRQWVAACRPVLRPLLDAAVQIGLLELVGGLGALDAALERAANETAACIGDGSREALQAAYERLRKQMPEAFSSPDHADGRRMVILESLLLQVPSCQRRTLAKLYAAGLNSLPQLSQAKADEVAVVAGIELELARAIIERVQSFERERSEGNIGGHRNHVQERLRAILLRLNQLQSDFERAEEEDSRAKKREARREREAAVLELDVVFAEVGDMALIEELKRYPVRNKIERVESYLDQLQSAV